MYSRRSFILVTSPFQRSNHRAHQPRRQHLPWLLPDDVDYKPRGTSPLGSSKELIERDDVITTLLDMKKEGKVRYIGSSSILPSLADLVGMGIFDAFQIPYSALNREHEQWITKTLMSGSGTIIRGGVSKGTSVGADNQVNLSAEWKHFWQANLEDLMDEGESPTAFVLRFTLSHPNLNTTIVGTKHSGHLKENIRSSNKGILSQQIYEEAKKRLGDIGIAPK